MFWLKEKFDFDEIMNGDRVIINFDDNCKFRCKCPGCGKTVKATSYEICDKLVPADDFSAVYCKRCSKKLQARSEGQKKLYRVFWDDDEGVEREIFFRSAEDARLEARGLLDEGYGVGVTGPDGNPVHL